jgi:hypothetical protein
MNGYTNSDDPNWNLYMPGHKIAMPMPLSDGLVTYADGTPQTVAQYAKDVASFLTWAAEPKLEERKKVGFRVIVFLILFATLLYFVKRKICFLVLVKVPHGFDRAALSVSRLNNKFLFMTFANHFYQKFLKIAR